jgi:hypothetical protein
MRPRLRKAALVAHVASSVGWLGAVTVSFALAVVGVASSDAALVRAVYLILEPLGWSALVPFSLAALLTGLWQALGTSWGLLRHYWVIAKLAMNVAATGVLLLYMQTLGQLAGVARAATDPARAATLGDPSPVIHSAAAIVLLLVALVLSVYKPRGLTARGARIRQRTLASRRPGAAVHLVDEGHAEHRPAAM